jgi:hypothetical protein
MRESRLLFRDAPDPRLFGEHMRRSFLYKKDLFGPERSMPMMHCLAQSHRIVVTVASQSQEKTLTKWESRRGARLVLWALVAHAGLSYRVNVREDVRIPASQVEIALLTRSSFA